MSSAPSSARSRARRFLNAFNRIENQLAEDLGDSERFTDFSKLVDQSRKLVNVQKQQLKLMARLRNSIVHNEYFDGEPIADPRLDAVEWIEQQAEIVENPPRALSVIDAQQPTVLAEDEAVSAFFPLVTEQEFSQAPVRLADGGLSLITTNAIARWLAGEFVANRGIAEDAPIAEVLGFAEAGDRAVLAPRTLNAVDAVRMLAGEEGTPPGAIVITEHGKAEQAPLALCTHYDLPELLAALGIGGDPAEAARG